MHSRVKQILGGAACLGVALAATLPAQAAKKPGQIGQWGLETVQHIDQDYWIPSRGLYADSMKPGEPPNPKSPAFMWGNGVEFSALNAAARLDPKTYIPEVRRMIDAIDKYWVVDHGVGGYEVLPRPNPTDRYYDDNAWVVLDLADAYDLTHDPAILQRDKDTFQFVDSGEDTVLGGGIYWHEQKKDGKNTCVNAPAICGALRLYQITHDPTYLATAQRLYTWTNAHLQDTDGLYFDNINIKGDIGKAKFSYNTALMIRANTLFYQITHQKKYLTEAERVAQAAMAKWVVADTGAFQGDAAFANLLSDSFLFLYQQNHDQPLLTAVRNALTYLHISVRDANGNYGGNWDKQADPAGPFGLLAEASAARGYCEAAPLLDR
jgi:rhamnogalacturonyl hydrolase YesR